MDDLYFNYYLGQDNYAASGSANEAIFVIQQCWPFIELQQGSLLITNCHAYGADRSSDPIVIEILATPDQTDLIIEGCTWHAPTVRLCAEYPAGATYERQAYWIRQMGGGQFRPGSILSAVDSGASGYGVTGSYRATGAGSSPYQGYRPARWAIPFLTKTDVAAINTATPTVGTVPLVYGQTIYQTAGNGVDDDYLFVKSAHRHWSYGKDLTVSWNTKGYCPFISLTGGADRMQLFPGLRITLDVGGATDFVVIGVHDTAGFAQIMRADSTNEDYGNFGTAATTYSGSTIGQAVVWLRTYGSRAATVAATLTGGSVTPLLEGGTVINITATSNVTVGAPSNGIAGQEYTYIITQNGTGGWTVTWNGAFLFSTAWSNTGNTANKISIVKFYCVSSSVFRQSAPQQAYIS
jgi:hypothetical protein